MKQTIVASQERPLLAYAISKLIPGVFKHPAWVLFGSREAPLTPGTLQALFKEAEHLRQDHPRDACQVLLICAVHQNYSGRRGNALATLQQALDLAGSAGLDEERLCILWGACAVCLQQGSYPQADLHFKQIQAALAAQNEWILADYIDIVRQCLSATRTEETGSTPCLPERIEADPLLASTYDLLYRWGFSGPSGAGADFPSAGHSPDNAQQNAKSPAKGWQTSWHSFKLRIQGELTLQRAKSVPDSEERHVSFWDFLLRRLRNEPHSPQADMPVIDLEAQDPDLSSHEEPPAPPVPLPDLPEQQEPDLNIQDTLRSVEQETPALTVCVHMLGRFEISIQDQAISLPASRSLSVLKYLLASHKEMIPREVLMEIFWPDSAPDTARNNLNVAIYGIRKVLHKATEQPLILHKDGAYGVAPGLQLWLDVEEFECLVSAGKQRERQNQMAATSDYEAAISLYQGDFLQENLYEEWTVLPREQLRVIYLETLDHLARIYFEHEHYVPCVSMCQRILSYDPCREDAYCLLMRCYSRQGQDHLALRQYQTCLKALRCELEVEPARETAQLYERIRRREHV